MKQTRFTILTENKPSIRVETVDDVEYFVGYGAIFNARSRLIFERGKMFYEIIKPGAFSRILQDPRLDVVLTLDHDHFYNLGRTVSGNLVLQEDQIGLSFRAPVPNTQAGRDTREMIARGDYTDCSFMFTVNDAGETWQRDGDGSLVHYVNEVSGLFDVTICTLRGAYEQTVIDVERASRMYKELNIQEREGTAGSDDQGGDNSEGGSGSDGSSNDNPGDDDQEREGVEAENDLDKMILDLHKAKSGTSL